MPLLEINMLRSLARTKGSEHLDAFLNTPVFLEGKSEELSWEPVLCRSVYEQEFTVWQEASRYEIDADDKGRIIRFIDHGRAERAANNPRQVPPGSKEDILSIAGTTGLVSPHARVMEVLANDPGISNVKINQFVPGYPAWVEVQIDNASEIVISLTVTTWDEP